MKNSPILLMALGIFTLFACNPSKQALSEEQMIAAINKADAQLMVLVANKDADSLTKVFATDATIYPPGEAGSKGIKAVQNWYKNAYDFGLCGIKYHDIKVYGSDEQIIETGSAEFISIITGTNDTVTIGDYNYLNVWAKNDSTYVLKTQMWNEGASN
ncbi:MAG: YybH family protein [Sediminibacterium sp.]|jgi:ketosteroid isomerase-like protein